MTDLRTLRYTLNWAAKWYPNAEGYVQGFGGEDRRYTFQEANETARRVSHAFRELGVEKGDRIALLNTSNVENALAHYGATKIGAVPAGVHGREAPNPLADMINRIRASVLVFHPTYEEKVDRFRDRLEHTDHLIALDNLGDTPEYAHGFFDLLEGQPPTEPDVTVDPDDMAFINFSSGTTGIPKALVTRHGQINEMIHLIAGGKTDANRILNASTPSFMGWETGTLTNTAVGATTVYFDDDVRQVPELIEEERLTNVFLPPTLWRMVYESGALERHDLSSVESAVWSGEAMSPELYRTLREVVTENFAAIYGSTETMGSATFLSPHQIDEETIESVGKPGLNTDLRVIEPGSGDPDAEVESGEVGEIIITGPSVCTEVFDDPETTAELFHEDGWVFTGDLGYISDRSFVYLQGREDNMIISGGINVYAERVERLLENHPGVSAVAVVGTPHERWGEAVKAYVVRSSDELTADALDAWCRENDDLANYQRPREWEFVDSLPRTNTGKLDRSSLRRRDRD